MAGEPLYRKFGVQVDNPGAGMQAGINAQKSNLQDVLGGVKSLMDIQEQKYVEENTLNMQQYLKDNIRKAGLGADPTDQITIRQKFGSMINMGQVDETIKSTTKAMEGEAMNAAAIAANQTLDETSDPIQAREAFAKTIRSAGAGESLTNESMQAYSDSNATKFDDLKTLKSRATEARTTGVLDQISAGLDRGMAIDAAIADLPANEQSNERRRLTDLVEADAALDDSQKANRQYFVDVQNIRNKERIGEADAVVNVLENQKIEATKNGINDVAYQLAEQSLGKLGGSTATDIGDNLTNWVESWSSTSDKNELQRIQADLLGTNGANAKDVAAALNQAYGEVYRGDSIFGNNVTVTEIQNIEARAKSLVANAGVVSNLATKISAARKNLAQIESEGAEKSATMYKKLTDTGQSRQLRVDGSETIDVTGARLLSERLKKRAGGVGGNTPTTTPEAKVKKSLLDASNELLDTSTPAIVPEPVDEPIVDEPTSNRFTGKNVHDFGIAQDMVDNIDSDDRKVKILKDRLQREIAKGARGKGKGNPAQVRRLTKQLEKLIDGDT